MVVRGGVAVEVSVRRRLKSGFCVRGTSVAVQKVRKYIVIVKLELSSKFTL